MADSQRYPSSDELDYQRRLEAGFPVEKRSTTGEPTEVYAPFTVEDNDTSAYVGVSPEYMTYANETEKPLRAEEGVEFEREKRAAVEPVVATPAATPLDANTATAGGGASSDLVYTAYSGENYTAKKAVAVPLEVVHETDEASESETVTVTEPKTERPSQETATPNTVASPPAVTTQSGPQVKADNAQS